MQFLLDANALITAHNTWYGLNRVPEFWKWLQYHGTLNLLKVPSEIYAEIETGTDALAAWMKDSGSKQSLLLKEDSDRAKIQTVLSKYGNSLTEADLITIGQDPFLIAAALGHPDRIVVTAEVSKSSRKGANRHIPDVCNDCGVVWMHPVEFIDVLGFSTDWDNINN